MSTLEERVTAIEQHLGLNVVHGVFAEPLVPGAQVIMWCYECEETHTLEKTAVGWRDVWTNQENTWDYWITDARPGSIRRVR